MLTGCPNHPRHTLDAATQWQTCFRFDLIEMMIEKLTDILWNSIQQGKHDPDELRGKLSVEEAYHVQLGLLDRYLEAGEELAGWKVGLTAKAVQEQAGWHEPVFGFLLASGHKTDGVSFDFASLINPGFENELCLTMGKSLSGPDVTFDQTREAVSHVAPALEIIERRNGTPFEMTMAVSDNNQQKAFVTGTDIPLADLDLAHATVDVNVNNAHQEKADGAAVHGTPVASVQWLANKLAGYERNLETGQRIMSGSFTRQYDLHHGDFVESYFEPIGRVTATFK
jgi:2-keto-4-pentenoate hydratase